MRFLTVREAAERCRVSDRTIRLWAKDGRIPSVKPRKLVLIPEDALDAFLTGTSPSLEEYVAAVVEAAPELTTDQIMRLREILGR